MAKVLMLQLLWKNKISTYIHSKSHYLDTSDIFLLVLGMHLHMLDQKGASHRFAHQPLLGMYDQYWIEWEVQWVYVYWSMDVLL